MSVISTVLLLYLVANVVAHTFGAALAQLARAVRAYAATRSPTALALLVLVFMVLGMASAILSEYYRLLLPVPGTTYMAVPFLDRVAEWIREQVDAVVSR